MDGILARQCNHGMAKVRGCCETNLLVRYGTLEDFSILSNESNDGTLVKICLPYLLYSNILLTPKYRE